MWLSKINQSATDLVLSYIEGDTLLGREFRYHKEVPLEVQSEKQHWLLVLHPEEPVINKVIKFKVFHIKFKLLQSKREDSELNCSFISKIKMSCHFAIIYTKQKVN